MIKIPNLKVAFFVFLYLLQVKILEVLCILIDFFLSKNLF